jgi:hypothetical protein
LLGFTELRNELVERGLRGAALRAAYVSQYDSRRQATGIFAHEGRHVLDKRAGISDGAELEFRAKISEVIASANPLATFAGAVMGANTGDLTPHGRAQLRIVTALVLWMESHAHEIPGFDRAKPTLPQLYRLSGEQLRAFLRGIDPAGATS